MSKIVNGIFRFYGFGDKEIVRDKNISNKFHIYPDKIKTTGLPNLTIYENKRPFVVDPMNINNRYSEISLIEGDKNNVDILIKTKNKEIKNFDNVKKIYLCLFKCRNTVMNTFYNKMYYIKEGEVLYSTKYKTSALSAYWYDIVLVVDPVIIMFYSQGVEIYSKEINLEDKFFDEKEIACCDEQQKQIEGNTANTQEYEY